MKLHPKKAAVSGAAIAVALTLCVGLLPVIFNSDDDRMPVILETLLTPFYFLLLFLGHVIAWGMILGDNGTVRELQSLALAISLPMNAVFGAVFGILCAGFRRRMREKKSSV